METEETTEIAPEVVDRAKSMGWIPKEEFKGDDTRWRPADEYVQRADDLMPIMKSQMTKYEHKINQYESEIGSLKGTVESQKKTTEKLVKMRQGIREQEYSRAKKDLTRQQVQAVTDGNVDKWQNLEDQKEKLERPEPVQVEPEPTPSPVFDQWKSGNDWYLTDPSMTKYANFQGQELQAANPNMPYDQILMEVEKEVKKVFPQNFSNPNRETPSTVDGGNPPSQRSGGKDYNSLPPEARAQCDAFIADGVLTKEQYVKDYFEEA